MLLTAEEYFEQKRKQLDKYVEGEHKWFGDCSTSLPDLSCYPHPQPWYLNGSLKDTPYHTR
jgi:hypothetical protein